MPFAAWAPISKHDTVPELHSWGDILHQHTHVATGVTGVSAILSFESQQCPEWTFKWREKDTKEEMRNEPTKYWAGLETLMWVS